MQPASLSIVQETVLCLCCSSHHRVGMNNSTTPRLNLLPTSPATLHRAGGGRRLTHRRAFLHRQPLHPATHQHAALRPPPTQGGGGGVLQHDPPPGLPVHPFPRLQGCGSALHLPACRQGPQRHHLTQEAAQPPQVRGLECCGKGKWGRCVGDMGALSRGMHPSHQQQMCMLERTMTAAWQQRSPTSTTYPRRLIYDTLHAPGAKGGEADGFAGAGAFFPPGLFDDGRPGRGSMPLGWEHLSGECMSGAWGAETAVGAPGWPGRQRRARG